MFSARFIGGAILVGVVACQPTGVGAPLATPSGPPPPGRTFVADAPIGFDPHVLGIPVDGSFHAAPGVGPVFASVSVAPVPINAFTVDQKLVTTAEELSANATRVGRPRRERRDDPAGEVRLLPRRADDAGVGATGPRPDAPAPPWAVYYASKVYFGHSYVEVIKGDSNSFNARVAAHYLRLAGA